MVMDVRISKHLRKKITREEGEKERQKNISFYYLAGPRCSYDLHGRREHLGGCKGFFFIGGQLWPKTLGTCKLKEKLPDTNTGMMNDHKPCRPNVVEKLPW
jgi:hypothetical protein